MLKHPALRGLTLCLAAGLTAGSVALAQQKYRLHAAYCAGDTCTVDSTMDLNFMTTINVSGSGQGDQDVAEPRHVHFSSAAWTAEKLPGFKTPGRTRWTLTRASW